MEIVALILFLSIMIFILSGYPVAFTLGGLSVIAGVMFIGPEFFNFLPSRIMGVMSNSVLMAVPLFIFMGLMLQKSGLAEDLLNTMAILLAKLPGGLALSVVIVGALLAASTGVVGATVVTMGLISLPTMLKRGYSPELAAGSIAASGTLGQIIPPSIVLVLLGSVLNVSVGDLFASALIPGGLLVAAYLLYVFVYAYLYPDKAPKISDEELADFKSDNYWGKIIKAFLFPMLLIIAVLGSILMGIASPTEAAGVGALGAIILTALQRKFNRVTLKEVMIDTTKLTSMVFTVLIGATTFALVFRGLGGDDFLMDLIISMNVGPMTFLLSVMVLVFVAGFFIDFIEIIFIVVPVVAPVFVSFDMDLLWIGILLAVNLQTSFLTPPFGFSLFYLKGVAGDQISTRAIYRGVTPFLIIQLLFLVLFIFWQGYIRQLS